MDEAIAIALRKFVEFSKVLTTEELAVIEQKKARRQILDSLADVQLIHRQAREQFGQRNLMQAFKARQFTLLRRAARTQPLANAHGALSASIRRFDSSGGIQPPLPISGLFMNIAFCLQSVMIRIVQDHRTLHLLNHVVSKLCKAEISPKLRGLFSEVLVQSVESFPQLWFSHPSSKICSVFDFRMSSIRCSTTHHERGWVACLRREQDKATLRRLAAVKTR
jgi:hypothetical protein